MNTFISLPLSVNTGPIDVVVESANDSITVPGVALASKQDYANFESTHSTLAASTDTTITFSVAVRMVRVTNWDITNVILIKNGAISTNTDSTASRVGVAPALNVPNSEIFPITTSSIHIRSAGASTYTVEGFS